jgi:hypothetical protein
MYSLAFEEMASRMGATKDLAESIQPMWLGIWFPRETPGNTWGKLTFLVYPCGG